MNKYMGEFGIPGRRYLRKGGAHRTHQVHIFGAESQYEIERHLAVRDYLRMHPLKADAYAALKRSHIRAVGGLPSCPRFFMEKESAGRDAGRLLHTAMLRPSLSFISTWLTPVDLPRCTHVP